MLDKARLLYWLLGRAKGVHGLDRSLFVRLIGYSLQIEIQLFDVEIANVWD